jgi:hypothetical protein
LEDEPVRALALVDLDDTIFQTLRKCPPDVAQDRLVALGFGRDGAPLSYATPTQMNFLRWLSETTLLIPVTARSRDALERVRIDWESAICAHGGMIVAANGLSDPAWRARIETQAALHRDDLLRLEARVRSEVNGKPMSIRILEEEGTALYLLIKHPDADIEALDRVIDAVVGQVPEGWTIHRNGNNAALLPPFLGKQHAVAYLLQELRERHPERPIIGIGDSLTDAPFLGLCDFAMMPTGSQLAAATLLKAL